MSETNEVTVSSVTIIDELTEAVAVAQRKSSVLDALVLEYRSKSDLAMNEAAIAHRSLELAQHKLFKAASEAHAEAHGKNISDEDRSAFEERWAANIEEIRVIREERDRRRAEDTATLVEQTSLAG